MREMTGGEAVVETLKALGVEHVFGIVSVHNIPIYDAILRDGSITPISVRHEQGALHAADGYARATGKLGVAITSTGPGAANGVAGLYEAQFASSPVLMLTGQVETRYYSKGKGFLHEAEQQLPMLRTVTRRTESVRRTEDIGQVITHVVEDMMTGRPQPGAVEIPIDLQYASADIDIPHVEGWPRIEPDRTLISQAADDLSKAKHPLIWAGGGVIRANASTELAQLAERLNAPVFTTVNGRGAIPEDHPLSVGNFTTDRNLTETVESADVILAAGTRFQAGATANWQMKIPGRIIHLDADPGVIGRSYPAAMAIVGDARLGLAGILRDLDGVSTDETWVEDALEARDAARQANRELIGPDYTAIMDTMREMLPRNANIVRDSTVPAYLWGNRLLPVLEPRTSIHPTSAAIGPGLPLAIGAAIGTGAKTLLIQGDGGFLLSIGELATLAQHPAQVIACVFNDRGYGVLRSIQDRTFEGRQTGVDLATPDFAGVARAMGIKGEPVDSVESFRDAFTRAVHAEGPTLLDIDMTKLAPMSALWVRPRDIDE
jgi:acetolactate synthase-1/2/3 large subunit